MRRPSRICSLVGSYAIIGMVSTFGLSGQAHSWPVIKPLKESHTFINPGENDADQAYERELFLLPAAGRFPPSADDGLGG